MVILDKPTEPGTWKVSYYLEIRTVHSGEHVFFYLDNKFKKRKRSDSISNMPWGQKIPNQVIWVAICNDPLSNQMIIMTY